MAKGMQAHPSTFFDTTSPFPPSYHGSEFAYLFAVFGMLSTCLVGLEWLQSMIRAAIVRPAKWNEPITAQRLIYILMLTGTLMAVVPNLLSTMMWPEWSAEARATAAWWTRMMVGARAYPFIAAWIIFNFSMPVIGYQLAREPLPVELWPSWRSMLHLVWIGGLVFFIACGVTFTRDQSAFRRCDSINPDNRGYEWNTVCRDQHGLGPRGSGLGPVGFHQPRESENGETAEGS
jgi:hypothetical protein